MPGKRKLPRGRTTLPKGRKRKDYTPEALAAFDRQRDRVYQERHRRKVAHLLGVKQVSFPMPASTRKALAEQAKAAGLTRSAYLIRLIEGEHHD